MKALSFVRRVIAFLLFVTSTPFGFLAGVVANAGHAVSGRYPGQTILRGFQWAYYDTFGDIPYQYRVYFHGNDEDL